MRFEAGSENTLVLRSGDYSGLKFNNFLTAAVAGTAFTKPTVDWSEININVKLFQDGLKEVIYNGKLYPLLMAAHLQRPTFSLISEKSTNHANIVRLASAVGVKEKANMGLDWFWGDTINLRGGDKIEVVVDMDSNSYHTSADPILSYMDCKGINSIGVQRSIPKWVALPLNSQDENPIFNLGNNITRLFFVNLDKASILDADAIIDNCNLASDRLNYRKKYEDLIVERVNRYPSLSESNDRHQSFVLHTIDDGLTSEIDEVVLKLDVWVSNINASKNYIVASSYVTHQEIIKRLVRRNFKHQQLAEQKVMLAVR